MADQLTSSIVLEEGSYEIIRKRIYKSQQELESRLHRLNQDRKRVFGRVESELKASVTIHTDNNCIAQDIYALGKRCLLGFNVHIGLRAVTKVSDVFAVYRYEDERLVLDTLDFIDDSQFKQDRHAGFYRYWSSGAYLYMIFQATDKEGDYKAFKWLVKDTQLQYLDNRSEHEYKVEPQYAFEWKKTTRDDFRRGQHPHVSIEDRVFVETVGGDLTIKIEDNTDDGKGIYRENVDNKDQQLDDAEISYASLGSLIALRIKPFMEAPRYFLFNQKLEEVVRMDAMRDSCQLLPDDQGIMVSNAYYLETGAYKIFDIDNHRKRFERRITSSNGEDHLYVYFDPVEGRYTLMTYNVITQLVEAPLLVSGYGILEDGTLGYFRRDAEPTKNHTFQLWTTPFRKNQPVDHNNEASLLYKIGNKELVSLMSDCASLMTLMRKDEPYSELYQDVVNRCVAIRDAYFWIDKEEAHTIGSVISEIQKVASTAIDEFKKVVSIRRSTQSAIHEIQSDATVIAKRIGTLSLDNIITFVTAIAELRAIRGRIRSAMELRYTDTALLESLEADIAERSSQLERDCTRYLLQVDALGDYEQRIREVENALQHIKNSAQADDLISTCEAIRRDLELLIDIVSSLQIDDPTETTQILDSVSNLYSRLNGIRAKIKLAHKEIRSTESKAEFDAQLRLLDQSTISAVERVQTPTTVADVLSKLMVALEEIEGKFVDHQDFLALLHERRETIQATLESKRLQLLEAQSKRTLAIAQSASRLIDGIINRSMNLKDSDEINSFFASDMMVSKVRGFVTDLRALGEAVKADEIAGQLKSAKEEVLQALRDKQDLYVHGADIIKLGDYHFSVNTQAIELMILPVKGMLNIHLSGTDYFQPVNDPELAKHQDLWEQSYVSESPQIYRGEYLLYQVLASYGDLNVVDAARLKKDISQYISQNIAEGYEKGIHDVDALVIGTALLQTYRAVGLLRYNALARAWARYAWHFVFDEEQRHAWHQEAIRIRELQAIFSTEHAAKQMKQGLHEHLEHMTPPSLFDGVLVGETAEYMCQVWLYEDRYVVSAEADALASAFVSHLKTVQALDTYHKTLKECSHKPELQLVHIHRWLHGYLSQIQKTTDHPLLIETTVHLLLQNDVKIQQGDTHIRASGLLGEHQLLHNGSYGIAYDHYFKKLKNYTAETLPRWRIFQDRKHAFLADIRQEMRLEELKPKVLSAFVRNQLIDKVYMPLIGNNLAKQMGSMGEESRTDRMGLLLLVSPPGYGKTTLMEYIAHRLGLTFVKINGPALGPQVTSLDPAYAGSAAAQQELEKLNMSFEIGDNIMIYVDDIQHCHPEFLQKFISLTDGQRKIEGVYRGRTQTYDFRGKRVAVVMAGNPYTESGIKFQVPDMLANRADVYNLGEVIGNSETLFQNSYLENALSVNPILQRLASKSLQDVYTLMQHISSGDLKGMILEGDHTPDEIQDYINVMKKLMQIRDVVLLVNQAYIHSAAISDAYRVEPPFRLQGSYRNMNRMVQAVVPVMNDEEIEQLIMDHYQAEVQTLTHNAEANMLLFKRLIDRINMEEKARLQHIINTFQEDMAQRHSNNIAPVLAELRNFSEILKSIRDQLK